MRKYVTEELELEPETLTRLQELAEEYNCTIDTIVNEILVENIATKISLKELGDLLVENDHKKIKNYYTVVDNNQTPIVRIVPV